MARDAEDTRRRLLDAAVQEFAERGIAGARIDRIAATAKANKALIYTYFGNKEELFDAVFDALVVDTVHDVPIDADDLPGYAGRLFDHSLSHPQALRLAIWHSLERGGAALPEAVVAAERHKIEAIARAQAAGTVSGRFPPEDLMVMITALAVLGTPDLTITSTGGDDTRERRRRSVTEAVRLLTEGDA